MKKILAFMLCVVLMCATPIVAFAAEGDTTETVEQTTTTATTTEDVEADKPMTEVIVDYITSHLEEISVIITLLLTLFYNIRKHRALNGSIGTLNNNAIAVAENSASAIKSALAEVEGVAGMVDGYKGEIALLLAEIRKNAEEKQSLEKLVAEVEAFLKSSKLATLELSNEVAELLVLANIPNSKKDELYARHVKAVNELEAVEEVMNHDGSEA